MPESVSCPRCGCACRVQPHDHANCVQCFTSFRPSQVGPRLPYACPGCEQMSDTPGTCAACQERAREPQGAAVPLFTPAPAQMPGQTEFSLAAARDGRPMNSDEQRADRWARIAVSRENPGT